MLYGLTEELETAILKAVQSGAVHRVRTWIAPLHPTDQADLPERMPMRNASAMARLIDDNLDAETLTYLDKSTREAIIEAIGPDGLARRRREVLAALSAEDRVLVREGLSFPGDSVG